MEKGLCLHILLLKSKSFVCLTMGKLWKSHNPTKKNCLQWGLNSWPLVYKTSALPLSYRGFRWGLNTFDKSQSQICLGNIKSIVCCVFQKYLTWYECIKTPHCGHINVKKFYNIHSLIELTLFSEAFLSSFFSVNLKKKWMIW